MAELFKFRCSECGKLLGVSPRKVGKAIQCPQCRTELIVPSLDDPDPTPGSDASEEAVDLGDLGIDLGLASPLDIRPAERSPSLQTSERPAAELEMLAFLARVAATPVPEAESPTPPPGERDAPAEDADDLDDDDPEPLIQTPTEPLRPQGKLPRRHEPTVDRRRDVVLPRTAVVVWSLFAILSLGLSFAAGLLIGHYRWR